MPIQRLIEGQDPPLDTHASNGPAGLAPSVPVEVERFEHVVVTTGVALLRVVGRRPRAQAAPDELGAALIVDDGERRHRLSPLPNAAMTRGSATGDEVPWRCAYPAPTDLVDTAQATFSLAFASGASVPLPSPTSAATRRPATVPPVAITVRPVTEAGARRSGGDELERGLESGGQRSGGDELKRRLESERAARQTAERAARVAQHEVDTAHADLSQVAEEFEAVRTARAELASALEAATRRAEEEASARAGAEEAAADLRAALERAEAGWARARAEFEIRTDAPSLGDDNGGGPRTVAVARGSGSVTNPTQARDPRPPDGQARDDGLDLDAQGARGQGPDGMRLPVSRPPASAAARRRVVARPVSQPARSRWLPSKLLVGVAIVLVGLAVAVVFLLGVVVSP